MEIRAMRRCMTALSALAAVALAAPGLAAQQQGPPHRQHHGGAMRMEGHPGMMGGMGGPAMTGGPHGAMLARVPMAILHQAEALGLSDEQVARVEALRDSVVAIHGRRMTAMQGMGGDFAEAFTDDGIDLNAYRSALRSAADRMVETRVAVAEVAQSALQVLDASQREKFLYALHVMHRGPGMEGAMHGGGMMHGQGAMHEDRMTPGHGRDADCPVEQDECTNGPDDEGGS